MQSWWSAFLLAVLWRPCLPLGLAQEQNWPEYLIVSPPRPELIQLAAGKEVRMHCSSKAKHPYQGRSYIRWTYKRCGFGYNFTNCDKVADRRWENVTCKRRSCHTRLTLTNTTENDSGLYRCMYKDNVIKIYQLDVVDKTVPPPQLLDKLPANLTVLETNPAVMMCRVLSKQPPSILWFRRHDVYDTDISNYIQYLDSSYERLNDSSTVALTDELYLSKLIIPRTSQEDTGYYTCLAINAQGFSHRGAYLNVSPFGSGDHGGVENFNSTTSLLLLFLIPVALAVVPALSALACWMWCRRCGRDEGWGKAKSQPVSNNNNNNNNSAGVVGCRYTSVAASHAHMGGPVA